MTTIEDIMRMDNNNMKNLPWNKLDRYLKLNKIYDFVKEYQIQQQLSDESTEQLKELLKEKINKKLLNKTKDVEYDTELNKIISIPALVCLNGKFKIHCSDTASPLHSLTPKNKTVKKPLSLS
jgi:hypothetical protein